MVQNLPFSGGKLKVESSLLLLALSERRVYVKVMYQLFLPVLMWILSQLTWCPIVYQLVSELLTDGIDPNIVIYSVCPY